jgi:Zn-dependent peptidase ImmA (M78 family)
MWRLALEDQGVLVLQLGLGKDGIRGFSFWDAFAPLIAVNSAYNPSARVFTLFHELGHLVTRGDAACFSFFPVTEEHADLERWCERFAAELLMPTDAVLREAGRMGYTVENSLTELEPIRRLANHFHVSVRAAVLRLQELRFSPSGTYQTVDTYLSELDWNARSGGGHGMRAPEKRLGQLGERVPRLLLDAASRSRLTPKELSQYLRLTTGQVDDLREFVRSQRGE